MYLRPLFLVITCLYCSVISAQYYQKEKILVDKTERATSEAEKIKALGELSEFYSVYKNDRKADSVLQKQLLLAEVSNDQELIKSALFNNSNINLNDWSSIETFQKAVSFIDKGLKYASETGNEELELIAHLRKAMIYRKRGMYDNAMQQITLALAGRSAKSQDSLKVAIFIEVGNIFKAKGETVSAYKNYNTAFDIAYAQKNNQLLSDIYHRFAELYLSLSNKELAKQNLIKSLELNKVIKDDNGLINDYIDLARITDEKEYFERVITLSEKLKQDRYILQGKRLMLAYLTAVKKSSNEALKYLEQNDDLKQSYLNIGTGVYYWTLGNMYQYSNKVDSALHYYLIAEPEMQTSYDKNIIKSVYKSLADCYVKNNDTKKAISYYEKSLDLSRLQNDFNSLRLITAALSNLFTNENNFKAAFYYTQQNVHFRDTLDQLAAERDVVLLEVDRENKRHEQDLADAEAHTLKIRNLQYVGISVAIAVILSLLLLSGLFPVSKSAVQMLGFVAFICFFEFIILVIDNWLHNLTHGEPLKIWLCKIVIIGILLPFHHYIEHAVVHFLASRKLMSIKEKVPIHKILGKRRKPSVIFTEAEQQKTPV